MALDKFQPYLFVSAGEQSNKYLTPTYADGVASFQAQRAQELTGLTVRIDPIQEGTGDPSPTNIRPISGRTGLTVTAAGKNLIPNVALRIGQYEGSNNFVQINTRLTTGFIPIIPQTNYYMQVGENNSQNLAFINYTYFDENYNWLGARAENGDASFSGAEEHLVNIRDTNAKYITLTLRDKTNASTNISTRTLDGTDLQFAQGSARTEFDGYAMQIPISWQTEAGTVYGGTLDVVSGVLTVDWDYIASYDGETLPGEWISDRDVYEEGTKPTAGAEVAYKLAEPVTYQLTPTDVKTLAGFNQIYSDAGPVIDIKF